MSHIEDIENEDYMIDRQKLIIEALKKIDKELRELKD